MANYHQFYYDELGRSIKDETRNLTSVLWDTETIYDAWSQQLYDANNHRRDTTADAFGQLVQVKEYYAASSFYTTNYVYDFQGNLTQVTDHLSNVTSMSYDLLGRKTAMSDPDMGSWQYQYDAVGNLTGQRDARSLWLYLEYDDLNRLIRKRRDTAGSGPLVAEYGYDAPGQKGLLSFSKAYNSTGSAVEVETQAVTYDARNRLTRQQWVVNGVGTFRLDNAYNEADQRTSLTYPGGTAAQQGEVVSYGYNAVGQLTGVSGSGVQYVSSATYNAQGQLTEMRNDTGGNGLTRQFVYETNTLRLNTIKAGVSSPYENLQKLTYAYDNAGNVTSLIDTVNSSQKQCFQYDWLDRLTGAFTGNSGCTAYSATGTGPYNHTYAYDAIGNITSYAGNTYTYGDAAHKHAVTAAFGNSYSYDANGNQTSRTVGGTTYTFTFDYENRLTAISGGSTSATFVYDADGNRVKGTVGGVTTVYVAGIYEYQGGSITQYYEGNAFRRSSYASDNGVFYRLQDHLKSSSTLVHQNGTLNASQYFYPFGGNRGAAFSPLTTKRFTGQSHEASLPGGEGLSYYNARWYDAKLGRFLSADSIVPSPAHPQAFNRYSYVLNNPLRFIDPSGHIPMLTDGNGHAVIPHSTCSTTRGCKASTPLVQDCARNSCRHPQVSRAIRFYARTYGIPEDLLGATLMVEAIDDQQFLGSVADFVNGFGLSLYNVGKKSIESPSFGSPEPAAVTHTIGSLILGAVDVVERWHGSPGIGANNIHIDTVRSTESYFQENYPNTAMAHLVSPGRSTPEVLDMLFSTDGNIRYAAAHLRMLTDLYTTKTESYVGKLTDTEMAIIFGAYRAGIEAYGGLTGFQSRETVGETQGPLFLNRLQQYRDR